MLARVDIYRWGRWEWCPHCHGQSFVQLTHTSTANSCRAGKPEFRAGAAQAFALTHPSRHVFGSELKGVLVPFRLTT